MALFPFTSYLLNKGAQFFGRAAGLAPKPTIPTADYNRQVQATHAEAQKKAAAKNAAAADVISSKEKKAYAPVIKSAPKPSAPPMASQVAAVSSPVPGLPGGTDPAMVVRGPSSGAAPATPGASAPQVPSPTPSVPAPQSQYEAAKAAYLQSLAPSSDVTSTQEQLGSVSSQASADVAAKQKEYADRLQAIQEQATLQPFLTGRQQQAQQQLTSQLEAIKAGTEAQTLPLAQRLAQFQAQQQARQQQAEAELGFAQPQKPVSIAAGGAVVDPSTGKVIYQAPFKPDTSPSVIQEYQFAKQQGYPGSFFEYQQQLGAARAGDPNRILSASEAQALGVPFGTSAGAAYGITPQKPLTDVQAKDLSFGTRMSEATPVIDKLSSYAVNANPAIFAAELWAEPGTITGAFIPDEVRQLRQAERNFLNAVLRRESGAVISPSEFAEGAKQYFPRPGDDAQTLAQKKQNRDTAMRTMLQAAGPAGSGVGVSSEFDW